ncbi:unnamed protein product [Calypogeia fissa]
MQQQALVGVVSLASAPEMAMLRTQWVAAASASVSSGLPGRSFVSLRRNPQSFRPKGLHVRAFESATASPEKIAPAITLTEKATVHLRKLRKENDALCLRIGVRQGGCSGMSYVMDFEDQSKFRDDDSIIEADGIKLVCDPKSLLFLFGMQLDYSDALIGGGFSFNNPNASSSCGCGKSFAA